MFGWGKKDTKLVGAQDKLALARQIKESFKTNIQLRNNATQTTSQTVPVMVIFMIAVGLAFFMTDGGGSALFGGHPTGIYKLDLLLVGSSIPNLIGDADINRVVVIFIRGFVYFLLTGLAPFIAFLFINLIGKNRVNSFVACWLVICITSFLYMSMHDLLPALRDIKEGF
ncbi:MAG: hypothetical protein KAI76_06185 [Alphaproteobacteria bacterium]|nr:hypothetical protein [Alphaproteobacteria bacterium]